MDARRVLRERVEVDARALAAFRVALALVVLLDLALRSRWVAAFYTDAGVLPRATLYQLHPTLGRLSVHALSGAAWFQWLLFAATALAALALLAGFRTRLATFLAGLLVVSLHVRNPLVLNGGDLVLQMLFLWGLFMPLGERWSVDALRGGVVRERVVSVATAGLLLQVVVIYATNAVLKLRGDAWLSGEAIRYVFSLEMFVVGLGGALADHPALLELLDRAWLALLAGSFLLVVLTGWLRAALAAAFAAGHAGMLLTMQLGVFPLVSIVALVPFLPAAVWDALPSRSRIPAARELPVEDWQSRVRTAVPVVALPSLPPAAAHWGRRAVTVALVALLAVQLAYNAASVGLLPTPDAGPLDGEEPEPRWNMFAPDPLGADLWLKAPGTTASGERVDAFHGGAFTWDKPPDVSASYPTARWRKYATNLVTAEPRAVQAAFAGYLCSRWDARHDARLVNVTVYAVQQPTRLDGPEPTDRVELADRGCG